MCPSRYLFETIKSGCYAVRTRGKFLIKFLTGGHCFSTQFVYK